MVDESLKSLMLTMRSVRLSFRHTMNTVKSS
uniref:Uncharacterized protein n=1 Tax=Rhizobium phage IG49 TaxID=3129228 RepID=A0AAU8HZ24_9CAUD